MNFLKSYFSILIQFIKTYDMCLITDKILLERKSKISIVIPPPKNTFIYIKKHLTN